MNKIMKSFFRKIANKELAIGAHVQLGDPCIVEMFGEIGFDAVWIDTEHTGIDKRDLLHSLISLHGYDMAGIVRIPWNDPVLVKPVLEMGPDGVIIPYVRSVEEVELAIKSCLYPPLGIRGFGPIRANAYGRISGSEYIEKYKDEMYRIVQIEHVDAVKCITEIMKVPYLSAVVMGPMDLSASLGVIGQPEHPDVVACIKNVAAAAKNAGIPFGTSIGYNPGSSTSGIEKWFDYGVDYMFVGSDVSFVMSAGMSTLRSVREVKRGMGD